MIEMTVLSLRSNIEAKLNGLRYSSPLNYHILKTDYDRSVKKFKKNGMLGTTEHIMELEDLLERVDDSFRGSR